MDGWVGGWVPVRAIRAPVRAGWSGGEQEGGVEGGAQEFRSVSAI